MRARLGRLRRPPLTPAGWATVTAILLGFAFGWLTGWRELVILGFAGLLALAVGLPFLLRRARLQLERTIEPNRVTVGETAFGHLVVSNNAGLPNLPITAEDKVGNAVVPIDIPSIRPGSTFETLYQLPTGRRGSLTVGPAVIARSDPLMLWRSEIAHSGTDTLWVHPRYRVLRALPTGFAKDMEGPTHENAPKGDVSFHALREYVFGDDYRQIHWRSTARIGRLMVREHVDTRRPHHTVVIDPAASAYGGEAYELAVEVAASIGVTTLRAEQPISIRNGSLPAASSGHRTSIMGLLDALALVEMDGDELTGPVLRSVLRRESGTSIFVLVTGSLKTREELMALLAPVRRLTKVLVVRCWEDHPEESTVLPNIQSIDVAQLEDFVRSWNRLAG